MNLTHQQINIPGYEKVIKFKDHTSGLIAIIAIHNTKLGPGLGGTRILKYKTEEQALNDVLRLSKGMTYKSAITQAGLGGAKSVIIADPKTEKTPELLHSFAKAVNTLQGEYVCAEDVGCSPADIDTILQKTKYACGVHNLRGSGNPAAFTAWGTLSGIQSALQELDGSSSLKGKTIAIQGLGSVGTRLLDHLFWAGAKLFISDIDPKLVEYFAHKYSATPVEPDHILSVECDVLSPNALGGILNKETISKLKCRAIAGAANNQLLDPEDAERLHKRKILYAPDFVINAGGLINVIHELSEEGYDAEKARNMTTGIYDQLLAIYEIAEQNNMSTNQAAISLADHRIENGIGKRTKPLCFRFEASVK